MDSFTEDNTFFACAYCAHELGTLATLIENQILAEHECLKDSENVHVNYETKKIYIAENNVKDSECSSLSSSSQPNNVASSSSSKTHTELWTDNTVKLLIDIYKHNKNKFDSPSFTKKKVWEIISLELSKFGYNKSGVKCDEKWRNLRKMYDKVRTELNKTGNSKITWKFYEDFQEMYWKDPHFVPIATASSTADSVKRKLMDINNYTTEKEDGNKKKNLSPGEKRKIKPSFTAAEIEIRKQKRHEEKMKLKKEIFEWFKENNKKNKD
ncbi:hypothetical protein JTB14_007002 [Gonioctena quinquepunctata]|nr:hypothetical protein JTB14_007002 [Gonioctena quinquepunctata]